MGLCVVGALLGAVGCGDSRPPIDIVPDDAGAGRDSGSRIDGGSGRCEPGTVYCSGNESYRCNEAGEITQRVRCEGATSACVAGMGCRVCTPNAGRCNPERAQQIQTCRADGAAWVDGATCDEDRGQTCSGGACADRCSGSATGRSYLGCDYWPTVTANSQLDAQFQFGVVLSNPQTYTVRANITGGGLTQPRTVTLAPGAVETVTLPWVNELIQFNPLNPGCRGTEIGGCPGATPARSVLRRNGAYHVQANGPIAAYQFNPLNFARTGGYFSFTNDASLLLPQGVLTNRYTVSTWPNWQANPTVTAGGFIAIVGVAGESTSVTVRPTAAIAAGNGVQAIPRGGMGTFSLQPGDVVQLLGTGAGDLSGTTIESSAPVAVFVGHDCTNVPTNRPACDHLEEQLFPTETWGRDYFVSALRDRGLSNPSVVRIVSQRDGNQLTFDPPSVRQPATLNAGQVLELATTANFRVTGTGAFLVAQYMIGQGPAMLGGSGAGDPAMVFEVPTQQYRTSYDFLVPATYQSNFINIVAPQGAQLTMDDQPVRGSMENVSGYTIYTLPIVAGAHRIRSQGQQFGIKVYGIAQYTSYMYPGGLDLALITPG